MSELIEYMVGYRDEVGKLQFYSLGAQSVYGRTTAEKLVKKLGNPWALWHVPNGIPTYAFENQKETI